MNATLSWTLLGDAGPWQLKAGEGRSGHSDLSEPILFWMKWWWIFVIPWHNLVVEC